ncbi:uncharacterized protein LOC110019413 [Phalaenopsis equestris]|uniref:uncharacterized protein LOC110019413 n=1 Tax=Phalaenopsis equestris TaxID=78828 RepID=UPI0009E40956|nr:uncharacterized protein LOC110019413 [Phalaenopsis equestris]
MRALLVQQGVAEALQGPAALPADTREDRHTGQGPQFDNPELGRQSYEGGVEGDNGSSNLGQTREQINEFNKIIDDLENIDVKMDDEDKALLLLNSISKSYEHFKDVVLYGRVHAITLEEVQSLIRAK